MPVTRITTNFRLGEDKQKLVDGFHEMMQETLQIKMQDRLILLDEKPDGFFQPTHTAGHYVFVEIQLFNGRSLKVKRQLYKRIVKFMQDIGVNPENTRIVLHEIARENWGIRGGRAACDVDLGYPVRV